MLHQTTESWARIHSQLWKLTEWPWGHLPSPGLLGGLSPYVILSYLKEWWGVKAKNI